MPAGLEMWTADGIQRVFITDRLTRILGSTAISGPGSITDYALNQGAPCWFFLPDAGDSAGPYFSYSYPTLSWTLDASFATGGYLFWGLY